MGALDVYYLPEHADHPLPITTPDEVDDLLATMSATSPPDAPLLAEIHLTGDPYAQGLEVGIRADRGVLRYTGRYWPHGTISLGSIITSEQPSAYFYMGHWREFPPNAEVSLPEIGKAIKEFLDTDGDRPTNVRWWTEQ